MNLRLERLPNSLTCAFGNLYVDDKWFCFTLEDHVREIEGEPVEAWKIKGTTAIPRGEYEIRLTYSNRFKRTMPQLMNVPGFEGIRIHAGNTDADTDGCILVGDSVQADWLGESKKAYDRLYALLEAAKEPIYIEVR